MLTVVNWPGEELFMKSIFTGYIESAMSYAEYDKLEDGTFSGRIPILKGVIVFGKTLRKCEADLQSTLEEWILLGLKMGHTLPVINGFDLNKEPTYEAMEAV
jgi:predicted RNase H-like HicB family nuclease